MTNYMRALRYALPYWRRMTASILCALVVALFWGANISALYPVLNVLLQNQTLVGWVDDSIQHHETKIVELKEEIARIDGEIRDADSAAVRAERTQRRERRESQLASRQSSLNWYVWARPTLVRFTPSDSFTTLAWLLGLTVVGVMIKGVFDFLQEYLASSVVYLAMFDLRNEYFRKTLKLDLGSYSDQGTTELMARFTNDLESLSSGMRAL
ncbi:MAG: ABC transporter transmembrane domain-containing protein, partial [Planctomycetia bacterium]